MSGRVTCPHCGAKNPADDRPGKRIRCRDCGEPFGPRRRKNDEDGGSTAVVVVWVVAGLLVCVAVGLGVWMATSGRGGNPVPPGPVATNNPPRPAPPGPAPNPIPNPNPPWQEPVEPAPRISADPKLEGAWDKVYLADLAEFDVKMGPWPFAKNGTTGHPDKPVPIEVAGVRYPKGLSVHPPQGGASSVKYALGGRAGTLVGACGFNEYEQPPAPVNFQILGDGRVLWETKPMKKWREAVPFRVDVRGVATLELRAHAAGFPIHSHAVWLDPHLLK